MGLIRLLLSVFASYPDIAKAAMAKHAASGDSLVTWMRDAILDGKLATEDYLLASRVFSAMMGGFPDSMTRKLKKEIIRTFLARYGKIGCA